MKRNIAIVAGGDSSEIVISLKSAEGIFSFLDKDKYNVCLLYTSELRYITAPFLVDSSGHIRKFIPDKNKLVTQELWIEKGKTPRNLHFWDVEKEYFIPVSCDSITSEDVYKRQAQSFPS